MLMKTRARPGTVRHRFYGLNPLITQLRQHGAAVVALRLGYADAPSFSHAFKRWTGRSPRGARAAP